MKREILFKGKRVDNGEWVEGFLMQDNFIRRKISCLRNGKKRTLYSQHEVEPETVCQFTGLLDKNENKIFDGDKITYLDFRGDYTRRSSTYDGFIDGWIGVIEWSTNDGWILNKANEHNKEMLKAKDSEKFDRQAPYIYCNKNINRVKPKIIGNIHD